MTNYTSDITETCDSRFLSPDEHQQLDAVREKLGAKCGSFILLGSLERETKFLRWAETAFKDSVKAEYNVSS